MRLSTSDVLFNDNSDLKQNYLPHNSNDSFIDLSVPTESYKYMIFLTINVYKCSGSFFYYYLLPITFVFYTFIRKRDLKVYIHRLLNYAICLFCSQILKVTCILNTHV